ncbi:hypothetical protein FSARC_11615 [Fusarium sarcochroum]|uniref:PKD domain-containing protein n=1 Tax=Fusarium sarcochroum TaxID=1208366 RepID=A0A8H4TEX2_9HYPO|nr:hypothetical protein FSARC_11615 [Fusarium sarcochroum]
MWSSTAKTAFGWIYTAVFLAPAQVEAYSIIAEGPECVTKGTALQITPDCVDLTYNTVVIDAETDVSNPVPHRKVSGHFNGTDIDFNIYLPYSGFTGRFFQLVYPLQGSTAPDRAIGFSAQSGGYTNHVAGGRGYRADAAVAKLSRSIAAAFYKTKDKIYGYVYGGSGGSLVTVGAIENTFDIWQGAVPLIQAVPISIPNNFCIRAFAGVALNSVASKIADAVSPGGSGDPYSVLDPMRRDVLQEVTQLGVPLGSWEDADGLLRNRTQLWSVLRGMVVPMVKSHDSTYFSDFWTKDGYLGTEKSKLGALWRSSVYELNATIEDTIIGPNKVPYHLTLNNVHENPPPHGLIFKIKSNDGKRIIGQFTAKMSKSSRRADIYPDNNSTALTLLAKGVQLQIDNLDNLAVSAYHRHQVPTREGFYAWDFLRKEDGEPIYPQREVVIGQTLSQSASGGGTHSGNITAKVIVMDTLLDYDAFPWHADWYRNQVKKSLGSRFTDNFRLYFAENADHQMVGLPKPLSYRLVELNGLYERHLRDLSAWVENGTEPAAQTAYTIKDGQVLLPKSAQQRKGIQAVVELTVEGKTHYTAERGQPVYFSANIEVPANAGSVTSIEWDFEGTGTFVKRDFGKARDRMDVNVAHAYHKPGVYYPVVRVAVHADGDTESPYAQCMNLGRMRVIVW